jgi:hypothetical protein
LAKLNSQYAIHRAIRKYGWKNFDFKILYRASTKNKLLEKEFYYICKYDSLNPKYGYNMIADWKYKTFNSVVRRKISKSQKIRLNKLSVKEKSNIYKKSAKTKQGEKRTNRKYVGVYKMSNSKSYATEITYYNKKYRKSFINKEEAVRAYDKMALYLYGKDANLNFSNLREAYLKEDLELFFTYFTTDKVKQGRKPKKVYRFDELILESKSNAINQILRFFKQNKINEKIIEKILIGCFLYNGEMLL